MAWYHGVSWFFGWLFLVNALPHLLSGMMGGPFQSPFAKPPGEGLSSSTVNVLWGSSNLAIGYLLVFQVGVFDIHRIAHVAIAAVPVVGLSLFSARNFGRFNGGNDPGGE
jgi:hypothetical protein